MTNHSPCVGHQTSLEGRSSHEALMALRSDPGGFEALVVELQEIRENLEEYKKRVRALERQIDWMNDGEADRGCPDP